MVDRSYEMSNTTLFTVPVLVREVGLEPDKPFPFKGMPAALEQTSPALRREAAFGRPVGGVRRVLCGLSPAPGPPDAHNLADGGDEEQLAQERLEHGEALPGVAGGDEVAVAGRREGDEAEEQVFADAPSPSAPKNGSAWAAPRHR